MASPRGATDPLPSAPSPPPRIWPFLVALAAVAGLAELAYAVVNVSALPVFLHYGLGLPDLVSFSLGAFYLSESIFNSPMGSLADRVGRRRLMVLGPLVSVCTCLGATFLRVPHGGALALWLTIGALLGMRVLDGLGAAALWPAIFASIGDRVDEKRQAVAMSVLNITYMVGLAFGPLVGGWVNESFGAKFTRNTPLRYAPSFFAAAAGFLVAAVVAYFIAPRRAEQQARAMGDESSDPHQAAFSWKALPVALHRIPMLMLLVFVTFLGIGLIAPNAKLFAMERFGVSESAFGRLLLYAALPIAVLAIPVGRLGDIWGKARSIHLGMALCAISLWLILVLKTEFAVVALGMLLGVGFLLAFPAYMAMLTDLTGPSERGGMIGAVRMAQGVGAMIGTVPASFLFAHVSPFAPFLVAGTLLTGAFLLSLFYIRDHPAAPGLPTQEDAPSR